MRNFTLDGIRGWAALFVVLFHFVEEPLKNAVETVSDSWFFFYLNGTFFVCVFFVVSGQALSTSFMRSRNVQAIDPLLIKRYVRLTVPIVISCAVVFSIVAAGLDYHQAAAQTLSNQAWLGRFLIGTDQSVLAYTKYALMGVYTSHTPATSPNPFLWTMSIEMVGSLLVFCTCYVWNRLSHPTATVTGVALVLMSLGTFYSLFLAGIAISSVQAGGVFRDIPRKFSPALRLAALIAPFLSLALIHGLREKVIPISIYCLLAVISVISIQYHPHYRKLMTSRLSIYLGKISFPLYVIHFAVLISAASYFWSDAGIRSTLPSGSPGLIMVGIAGSILCIPLASAFLRLEKAITPAVEAVLVGKLLKRPQN